PRTRGAGISSQPCSTSASARRDSSQDSTCRFGFGQCAVKVLGRAQGAFRQHQARRLLYCSPQGLGCRTSGAGARERRPNESFKPMPHRGANHMAGTASHALHAPLRHGLTLVLGRMSELTENYLRDLGFLLKEEWKASERALHESSSE